MVNRSGLASNALKVLLLPLLLLLTAAAPVSLEKEYRDARSLQEKGLDGEALKRADAALARGGTQDNEWVWALRVLRHQLRPTQPNPPEIPAKYSTSEAALRRHLLKKEFNQAEKLARARYPRLLWAVYLSRANWSNQEARDSHLDNALNAARRHGNELNIAVVHASKCHRYVQDGRYRQALDACSVAQPVFERLGATGRLAQVLGNTGWAYSVLGNWDGAHEYFVKAQVAAARAGAPQEVTWRNQIGNVYLRRRDYATARREYDSVLPRAIELKHTQQQAILNNLALVAIETNRLADAAQWIKRSLDLNEDNVPVRILHGRVATWTNDYKSAQELLSSAATDEKYGWEAAGYLGDLYARVNRVEDADKTYRKALENALQSRVAIKDAEHRFTYTNHLTELFGNYIDFLTKNKRYTDALAITEKARAQTIEEAVAPDAAQAPLNAVAIARKLNATILVYWLGRTRSHLWTVTAGDIHYTVLPDDSRINKLAVDFSNDLIKSRVTLEPKTAKRGQELYNVLIAPAAKHIPKGRRVYVLPDGGLHGISFEALVAPSPLPHYWIEDVVVSHATSLQLLGRERPSQPKKQSILLVGNVPAVDTYQHLKNAQTELEAVAKHFAARRVLSGTSATPAAYRAAQPGKFAFVHFVAHGESWRAWPLESAVILARDAKGEYRLRAKDVFKQRLDAELVTISSCDSATGQTVAGEGSVGLAWSFLHAGAREVIGALWKVSDQTTPKLMDHMYAGIRAGKEPAAALREAKLVMLRQTNVQRTPKYWAPFVLYSSGG